MVFLKRQLEVLLPSPISEFLALPSGNACGRINDGYARRPHGYPHREGSKLSPPGGVETRFNDLFLSQTLALICNFVPYRTYGEVVLFDISIRLLKTT